LTRNLVKAVNRALALTALIYDDLLKLEEVTAGPIEQPLLFAATILASCDPDASNYNDPNDIFKNDPILNKIESESPSNPRIHKLGIAAAVIIREMDLEFEKEKSK